ncbi:uncharacterized protein DS421_3g76460 [Arachis hypogaea]|nr:uncharacterized protein DS421_3g76460 [Arachis hypogaea]
MVQKQSTQSEDFRSENGFVSQSESSNNCSPCKSSIKRIIGKIPQQIMQMIEKDKKHKENPTSSAESSSGYNQNEDDCFGIDLGED